MSTVSTARSRKRDRDDSRHNFNAVNLDRCSPVVSNSSQRVAVVPMGTRTSPIDVEALHDEERNRKTMKRSVVVVDLEKDTSQEGYGVAGTTSSHQRVLPVICISPDREEGTSFQPNDVAQISRTCTEVAPKVPIFTCPVCLNELDQPSTTTCGHIFCEKCIKASIKAQKKCPTCRKSLGVKGFHRVYLPASAD